MRAHFGLPSVIGEETEGRPPIHVRFEIPYFTVSGIQVSELFEYCAENFLFLGAIMIWSSADRFEQTSCYLKEHHAKVGLCLYI